MRISIAEQWHPSKNGKLTPDSVTAGSNKEAWWYLPYDDPKTGKHFDFEWQVAPYSRIDNNSGCPYLTNSRLWKGYNDFKTQHPRIAAQWHPTHNRPRKASDVSAFDNEKYWWQCENEHDFFCSVYSRTKMGSECPECRKSNKGIYYG